ncbi:ADP-ribosylation/crystallin J1 [Chitinophaga filiformis]|uniref:ADP-ribosylation/crystallin J1 n=1 Tax=Chitinophaga filiformis TaxID=104663 RepID=A0ABY4I534_CHIFI|nr:ADP-ribosylation/crystallin J1 [Chitinophaga filiformis]UPK71197.1 ADP-ribosylation/crystallin J1 [Chitinophaga filiformis]
METITLYRPTGLKEFMLIAAADFKSFPPRLSWQPIFYPVLNQAYAEQIAFEWNTHDEASGYCGIVTRFRVDSSFVEKYAPQNVGSIGHDELWIPAEDLKDFNRHIQGGIEIVSTFLGEQFVRPEDPVLAEMIISRRREYQQ